MLTGSRLWRLSPASLAARLSDGLWTPTPALAFVAGLLVRAAFEGNKRYLISMPPRHGKTELISRWAPVWFLDWFPDRKVGICSYAADLAHELSADVRAKVRANQDRLRVQVAGGSPAAWRTTAGGGCYASGVDGPITGRGFHLGLIDDPVKNLEDALSPSKREKTWRWYTGTFRTRIEPGGSIVVLQTRWHEDDLGGRLAARHSDEGEGEGEAFEVFNLPAIAQEDDLIGREPGQALFPSRYPLEALEALRRAVGPRVWAALFQGGPRSDEDKLFPRSGWVRYSQPPAFSSTVLSVDATFRDSKNSDKVAIVEVGFRESTAAVLDVINRRMRFTETVEVLKAKIQSNPRIRWVLIEAKANGDAILDALRGALPPGVQMIGIDPEGGKEARAAATEPFAKAGNIVLPEDGLGYAWLPGFLSELDEFPGGKHDDQVDALTQAIIAVWVSRVVRLSTPVLVLDSLARRSIWR
mgnify:FL=1